MKGQGHKVIHWPWSKVTEIQHFSNFFSWENAGPIEAKYHVEPQWDRGTKICSNGLGPLTKIAAMPIYGKNMKNSSSWNQNADDLESLYSASGTQVLPCLFKWWPWVDHDLFYGKVKFGPLCFYGKMLKQWTSQKLL